MKLLESLSRIFTLPARQSESAYWVYVRCNLCGEVLRCRVNFRSELSPDYDQGDKPAGFYCRKVLIGEKLCFQQIEVNLKFNPRFQLVDSQVTGGELISKEEFDNAG